MTSSVDADLRALITRFQDRTADEVADEPWLDAQIEALRNGGTLEQVAQGLGSFYGEAGVFKGAVGKALGVNNSQFSSQQWYGDAVSAMESGKMSASDVIQDLNTVAGDYSRDLGRDADVSGLNAYMDALIHGTSAGDVNNAIASSPEAGGDLRALITRFQDRAPDEVADKPWLDAQIEALREGGSLDQVAQGLGNFYGEAGVFQSAVDKALGASNSPIADQQWYGDAVSAMESGKMSASDVIQDLNTVAGDYARDLGRNADVGGLNTAMDSLIQGASASDVNNAIVDEGTQPAIMAQMQAQQDRAAQLGAQEFGQQMKSEQTLTQVSDAQNEGNNFVQTMASNAKSAVAKD